MQKCLLIYDKKNIYIPKTLILILISLVVISFILGSLFGYFIFETNTPPTLAEKKDEYPLISKSVLHEDPNDIILSFKDLRKELNEYILNDQKSVSVYFEYLPTGTSIGVNENTQYTGASLIKVPFVMHAYKLFEEGKRDPNKKIEIVEEDLDEDWGTLAYTALGKEYTIKELIYEVIVNSDNTALSALAYSVYSYQVDFPYELYEELDLPFPIEDENGLKNTDISPLKYAKILKALFFSSFLNTSSSSEILELMTIIKDGENLRANIPKDIKIAHKIGVNTSSVHHDEHIISDCGIIYVPNRPYILCVMVQDDADDARKYIQTISNMVYIHILKSQNQISLLSK